MYAIRSYYGHRRPSAGDHRIALRVGAFFFTDFDLATAGVTQMANQRSTTPDASRRSFLMQGGTLLSSSAP